MQKRMKTNPAILIGIALVILLLSALFAGCTGTPTTPALATPVATGAPAPVVPTLAAPVSTHSPGTVVAFTAASLKGVSPKLAADFAAAYPGNRVIFNLDGTQALRAQLENGAYADVFISASNSSTTALANGGYFIPGTVKPLTSNYVIVLLPAANPGKIQSLADLAKPGVKIAMEDKSVPAGAASLVALSNLAKSTYNQDWNTSIFRNIVTYETSEPGVATKVALGEVDAGFVYESTYSAAPKDLYKALTIAERDNYLQTYSVGVLKESTSPATARMFEDFILSAVGQQDLKNYGFRPL
ncbi:MAG: molybdate transport system substrate-binding protein [Methanoregula sp. SKADARSKE-2]|nr:MAG: molybdate transport system substrate-binding protein [Methanoregula sp. SKADARSKE-2]